MKPTQNLKLPKKDRPKGLYLFCNSCKRTYSNDKDIKCKCKKLVYKARIHVAGTSTGLIPKTLKANNFIDAVKQFYDFKEHLVNNSFQKVEIKSSPAKPKRLVECFAYYMGFLHNENVPKHKRKERDPVHIRKVDYAFELFSEALSTNGINVVILNFSDVNDDMVGYIHEYLLIEKRYSNKTYNNTMALLRTFASHIIKEFRFEHINPFLGVPDLLVTPKITSVRENEFNELLKIISPENGVEKRKQKGRENLRTTNWYKPWLSFAFRLGLYTGGRSEDVVKLKWSDVILGEDGTFDTLKTIDYKNDKANSNKTSATERMFKFFAITKELGNLLIDNGYEQYKNSDKYIIAPEDQLKRSNVARIISGAFTHYYRQLNTGREVTFRNLRKTFITSALMEFGAASTALTNHKNIDISVKHYQDKEVTRDEAKQNFSVFKPKRI